MCQEVTVEMMEKGSNTNVIADGKRAGNILIY